MIRLFPILFLLLIAGCSDLNSDFSCPMQPGHACNSLYKVNEMVDQGEITNPDHSSNLFKDTNATMPVKVWLQNQDSTSQNIPDSVVYY